MRTYESSSASDEIAHDSSVVLGLACIARIGWEPGRFCHVFAVTIAVGIWIVAIRIVIIGRARIDGVEYDAEQTAFNRHQEIARPTESFFGGFAAADNQQNAIGKRREDDRIRSCHTRGGAATEKFETKRGFGAAFPYTGGRQR